MPENSARICGQNFKAAAAEAATAAGTFFVNLPGVIAGYLAGLGAGLWQTFIAAASAAATAAGTFFANLPGVIAGYLAGLGESLWTSFINSVSRAAQTVLTFFANLPGTIAGYFVGFGAGLWDTMVSAASQRPPKSRPPSAASGRQMWAAWAVLPQAQWRAAAHGRPWYRHLRFKSRLAVARRTRHAGACGSPARRAGVPRGVAPFRRQPARVMDRMGHFALGGMVGRLPLPAGGAVGGMTHVTIAVPRPACHRRIARIVGRGRAIAAARRHWRRCARAGASRHGMPDAGLYAARDRHH